MRVTGLAALLVGFVPGASTAGQEEAHGSTFEDVARAQLSGFSASLPSALEGKHSAGGGARAAGAGAGGGGADGVLPADEPARLAANIAGFPLALSKFRQALNDNNNADGAGSSGAGAGAGGSRRRAPAGEDAVGGSAPAAAAAAANSNTGFAARLPSREKIHALSALRREAFDEKRSAVAAAGEGEEDGVQPDPALRPALAQRGKSSNNKDAASIAAAAAAAVSAASSDGEHFRRQLQQTSCPDSSGVTVTSSLFPWLEGCLEAQDVFEGGELEYVSTLGLIVALGESTTTSSGDELWYAVYVTSASSSDVELACVTFELASEVHPSAATWLCLPSFDIATDTTFGVACGCDGGSTNDDGDDDGTTVITTGDDDDYYTPAPSPTGPSPTPGGGGGGGGGSCSPGDSFTIDSPVVPGGDGCYQEVSDVTANDEAVYTQSGTADGSEILVYAAAMTAASDSTIHWWVSFLVLDSSASTSALDTHYCVSGDDLSSASHPVDVTTWFCNFASSDTDTATTGEIQLTCGCSSSGTLAPTSSPTSVSAGTTSSSYTASGSCGATEEFQLTSLDLPDIEGCFELTSETFSNAGSTVEAWSTDGTTFFDQVFVLGFIDDGTGGEGDTYPWYVAFLPANDDEDTITYCISTDEAITVHPSEATWYCDLTPLDYDSDFVLTAGLAECGCSSTPTDDSGPSPVVTGSTSSPTTGSPDLDMTSSPTPGSRDLETPSPTPSPTRGGIPGVIPVAPDDDYSATVPSPSPASQTTPTTPTTSGDDDGGGDDDPNACGVSEEFEVSSPAIPEVAGCFELTSLSFSSGDGVLELWTVGGAFALGQVVVLGSADDPTEDDDTDLPWYIAYLPSDDDDDIILYCASAELAVTVHPADATWSCDVDGTGIGAIADEDFSVACGCGGTPSPIDSTPADTTGAVNPRVVSWSIVAGAAGAVTLGIALAVGG